MPLTIEIRVCTRPSSFTIVIYGLPRGNLLPSRVYLKHGLAGVFGSDMLLIDQTGVISVHGIRAVVVNDVDLRYKPAGED